MEDEPDVIDKILKKVNRKTPKVVSEWRPFSALRQVDKDISDFGYSVEYAEKNGLFEKKRFQGANINKRVSFFEPLEVKVEDGEIYYRENDNCVHFKIPETFETQLGTFYNHNNGEFASWLGKDNEDDYFLDGRFCDMFDCGEYSYAVSNLRNIGAWFKIIRIDSHFHYENACANKLLGKLYCYDYDGRYQDGNGVSIIISGFIIGNNDKSGTGNYKDKTHILHIDNFGNCTIEKEWDFQISHPGSFAVLEDCAYFGQNKMITRLYLSSGERAFFTRKSEEEVAAMVYV